MKEEFIRKIKAIESDDWLDIIKAIEELPNQYAKGYLMGSMILLLDKTTNINIIKKTVLNWADLPIWEDVDETKTKTDQIIQFFLDKTDNWDDWNDLNDEIKHEIKEGIESIINQ